MLEIYFNGYGMMIFLLILIVPMVLCGIVEAIENTFKKRAMKKVMKDYENFYFHDK